MTFSGDDLKRLKKLNENQTVWGDSEMGWALDCLISLVARMEASEQLAEHHSGHDGDCDELDGGKCSCGYEKAETAWRQICGRTEK